MSNIILFTWVLIYSFNVEDLEDYSRVFTISMQENNSDEVLVDFFIYAV